MGPRGPEVQYAEPPVRLYIASVHSGDDAATKTNIPREPNITRNIYIYIYTHHFSSTS